MTDVLDKLEKFDKFDLLDRHTCKPSMGQRLAWLAGGVALGAIAAYLADPDRGHDRRAELQQRGSELAGQATDLAGQASGLVGQAAEVGEHLTAAVGQAAERTIAGTAGDDPALSGASDELTPDLKDPSDAVLIERVRSDAIGPSDVRNSAIVTTVEGGVVTVRGQVDAQEQRRDLLGRIRGVEGVEDVVDLTHLPDEPAPTRS